MLQNQAIDKLQAEIAAGGDKKPYLPVIGGFVIDRIREYPAEAALVLAEGKTLDGALKAMADAARKVAVNNCGVLTVDQGCRITLQYFGIQLPESVQKPAITTAPAIKTSFDDLF